MKKNNYKPRIVEFQYPGWNTIHHVDTRMGKYGIYPGDEWTDNYYGDCLCLGVDTDGNMCFAFTNAIKASVKECIFADLSDCCSNETIHARHAQHLIDSGEMIQAEEI